MDENSAHMENKVNENSAYMEKKMDENKVLMENKMDENSYQMGNKMDELEKKVDKNMEELQNSMSTIIQNLEGRISKRDTITKETHENKGNIHVEQPSNNKSSLGGFNSNSGDNYGWVPKGGKLSKVEV